MKKKLVKETSLRYRLVPRNYFYLLESNPIHFYFDPLLFQIISRNLLHHHCTI